MADVIKKKYRPFHETFTKIPFCMIISFMYPNRCTNKRRLLGGLFLFVSFFPLALTVIIDVFQCWLRGDIINVIRHTTIVGPFLVCFLKIILVAYCVGYASSLMEEINKDYESYNTLPLSHQTIIDESINKSLFFETFWANSTFSVVITFPIIAIVSNIYSLLFSDDPTRYMIHDVVILFLQPEQRLESPVYEIMFVYMLYAALYYWLSYAGYDGFIGLVTYHACLKMDLYCHSLKEAIKEINPGLRNRQISDVVQQQLRLFEFVDNFEDTFQVYLFLVLSCTLIQIGTSMFYVTESQQFDVRYVIFLLGAILILYAPCRHSTNLTYKSVETADKFYACGWEDIRCVSTRKTIAYVIARAQIPIEITTFKIIRFDMNLFVSIMKTSYSIYTFLRS